jgi:hypothetical protein
MTVCREESSPARTVRTETVLPAPTSPVITPIARNPAEFRQMHDLVCRDLRTCEDGFLRQALRMWR